ncbi:MAG: ABC transporter permease [Exilispira sp.]|jgi:ABC-2 type transport system permease protein|nr:ABC transporter permease [Exilispira sp.]
MNKISLKLLYIYFKQIFTGRFESLKKANEKENKIKSGLRQIGFIILIIYGFGSLLGLWGMISFELFSQLHALGDQKIQIYDKILDRFDLASISMTFLIVVIGFLNIIITFFSINFFLNLTSSEEYLLTLPIDDKTLFSSKIINISLTNGFFFIIMAFVQFAIYGIIEKVTFDYYIIFFIQAIIVNLFASFIGIAVSLFLVNIFKFLKNKDLMTYLSIFIFLPILIGYNIAFQKLAQNPSGIMNVLVNLLNKNTKLLSTIELILSPLFLFFNYIVNNIVKERTILRFLHYLIQVGVLFLLYQLIILIFGPIYKKLLLITNIKKEKINNKKSKNSSLYNEKKPFISLLKKEILSIYREPNYFLNGPFVIIVMPIILVITYYFSMKNTADMKNLALLLLNNKDNLNFIVSISIVISFLLGDFSSITSTAISREGKSFSILKTLPIKPKDYIFSKLTHGIIITFIGILLSTTFIYFLLKIDILVILLICIISLISSILFHIISLNFDITKPKLSWDNPIVAMKQNFNAVYAIFVGMGYAVFLFFQTKYLLKASSTFLVRLIPSINDKSNIVLLTGLILILLITSLENLIVYLISISSLEKKLQEIEL